MTKLHIDYEVYSEDDLSRSGVYRNAEHPSTEIVSCSYAFDDEPVTLWMPFDKHHPLGEVPQTIIEQVQALRPNVAIQVGTQCPLEIEQHIKACGLEFGGQLFAGLAEQRVAHVGHRHYYSEGSD